MFFDPNESVASPEDCFRLSQHESAYSPFSDLLSCSVGSHNSVSMISPDHCVVSRFRFVHGNINVQSPEVLTNNVFLPA